MQVFNLVSLSEMQSVWRLLANLRVIATSTVALVFVLALLLKVEALIAVTDWRWIISSLLLTFALSIIAYKMRHAAINHRHIFFMLLLDTALWFVLLIGSGGSINPAVSYLLVLLSIGALSLSIFRSLALLLVMMGLYTLMMKNQPAVAHAHMFIWHLWGMWLLFFLNASIILIVIYLLSRKLREKDQAIARNKEETVRTEQVIMLATMAANITHELGSPLSTIAMLVEDKVDEDSLLIQQQIQRCKKTLSLLKSVDFSNEFKQEEKSHDFIKRLQQELLLIKPHALIELKDELNSHIYTSSLLQQALLALLSNAVEAANTQVTLLIYSSSNDVILDIKHDGAKISEPLIEQLGLQKITSQKEGLGIGYYLANASIERLEGKLQISNEVDGVLTRVIFKKQDFINE